MPRSNTVLITEYEEIIEELDDAIKDIALSGGVIEYEIGDRRAEKYEAKDLLGLRKYYRSELSKLQLVSAGKSKFQTHVVKLC